MHNCIRLRADLFRLSIEIRSMPTHGEGQEKILSIVDHLPPELAKGSMIDTTRRAVHRRHAVRTRRKTPDT